MILDTIFDIINCGKYNHIVFGYNNMIIKICNLKISSRGIWIYSNIKSSHYKRYDTDEEIAYYIKNFDSNYRFDFREVENNSHKSNLIHLLHIVSDIKDSREVQKNFLFYTDKESLPKWFVEYYINWILHQ